MKKISRIKFVGLFLVAAAAFMIASTMLLGQSAETLLGTGAVGILLSPVKTILMAPLLPFIDFLRQDPDTPPPFFLAGFACYWTILALLLHYTFGKIKLLYAAH